MDFYLHAPTDAIDRDCKVCQVMVCAHEPVFMAVDAADDTGASVHVEHAMCHAAVEMARSMAYQDAAKLALHNGAADVGTGLELRAWAIERKLRTLRLVA